MSTRFSFCFPGDNGNVVCQHWNGSWIVFPGNTAEHVKTPPTVQGKDEVVTKSEKEV